MTSPKHQAVSAFSASAPSTTSRAPTRTPSPVHVWEHRAGRRINQVLHEKGLLPSRFSSWVRRANPHLHQVFRDAHSKRWNRGIRGMRVRFQHAEQTQERVPSAAPHGPPFPCQIRLPAWQGIPKLRSRPRRFPLQVRPNQTGKEKPKRPAS